MVHLQKASGNVGMFRRTQILALELEMSSIFPHKPEDLAAELSVHNKTVSETGFLLSVYS